MKKKPTISNKDKKDWNLFKDQLSISTIYDKEKEYIQNDNKQIKKRKLDLHGFSLDEANQKVKDFILETTFWNKTNSGTIVIFMGDIDVKINFETGYVYVFSSGNYIITICGPKGFAHAPTIDLTVP